MIDKSVIKGRDNKGRFLKGNKENNPKAAVKWTEETIVPQLEKILGVLTDDDSADSRDEANPNPVRANDIKYQEEAALIACVSISAWHYWNSKKFQQTLPEGSRVFELLEKIKKITELRLCYSGGSMDIFCLKNNYGYRDRFEQDVTTGGEKIKQSTLDLKKVPPEVLLQLHTALKK